MFCLYKHGGRPALTTDFRVVYSGKTMESKTAMFVVVMWFAGSNLVFSAPSPKFRNLSITVDNIMELFIDGIQITNLTNYNNRYKADKVPLSSNAKVIAVKGTDQGLVAGVLGSTDDGFIRTDSSWKCTGRYHAGWQMVDFDDSAWPAAHQAGIHLTKPWSPVSGIRKDAYWIWTSRNRGADLVVYCRKDLARKVPATCPGRTLDITVDSVMDLYIDGTKVPNLPNYYNWRSADSVCLASHPTVVAVKGINQGHLGGILASTEDGFIMTNSTWKCADKYFPGWEKETFDDYAWPAAYQVGLHESYPRTYVSGIRTDVYWIWTSPNNGTTDKVAYCRKLLVHPSESAVYEDEAEVNKRPVIKLFAVNARDVDNRADGA